MEEVLPKKNTEGEVRGRGVEERETMKRLFWNSDEQRTPCFPCEKILLLIGSFGQKSEISCLFLEKLFHFPYQRAFDKSVFFSKFRKKS